MKPYLLNLSDDDHKALKIEATKQGVTIKKFVIAAIKYYIDSIAEK